jgi:hypothetical protein
MAPAESASPINSSLVKASAAGGEVAGWDSLGSVEEAGTDDVDEGGIDAVGPAVAVGAA